MCKLLLTWHSFRLHGGQWHTWILQWFHVGLDTYEPIESGLWWRGEERLGDRNRCDVVFYCHLLLDHCCRVGCSRYGLQQGIVINKVWMQRCSHLLPIASVRVYLWFKQKQTKAFLHTNTHRWQESSGAARIWWILIHGIKAPATASILPAGNTATIQLNTDAPRLHRQAHRLLQSVI